jgi:hypothetical protein
MSATRAFIVRPFGVKEGIDFEEVERKLIAPALNACGTEGRTTAEITRQGNIREDMFRPSRISRRPEIDARLEQQGQSGLPATAPTQTARSACSDDRAVGFSGGC